MTIGVTAPDAPSRSRFSAFRRAVVITAGKLTRGVFDSLIAPFSKVPNDPVLDAALFPFAAELQENWRVVRAELEPLLCEREQIPPLSDISPDHESIADKRMWRSFFLCGYRYWVEKNCARCPETARMLSNFPGLETAMFSIMAPGTYVPHHRGVSKATLKFHLALIIPKEPGACFIEVDGADYFWEEGKFFIFDDCYQHAVTNRSEEERVVLLLEVRRPVRAPGSWFADFFMWAVRSSPFVQDARRNVATWKVG